jgi:hypothetical protein
MEVPVQLNVNELLVLDDLLNCAIEIHWEFRYGANRNDSPGVSAPQSSASAGATN